MMWPKKPTRHTVSILTGRKKTSFSHHNLLSKFNQICYRGRQVYIPEITIANPEIQVSTLFFCFFISFILYFAQLYLLLLSTDTWTNSSWNLAQIKESKHIFVEIWFESDVDLQSYEVKLGQTSVTPTG